MPKPTERQKREILEAVFAPLKSKPPVRSSDVVRLRSQCATHHHACDCRERKLLDVLKPHMTELKLEGLRGNQIAFQAFVDIDETWRELYGCSIENDERADQPNDKLRHAAPDARNATDGQSGVA